MLLEVTVCLLQVSPPTITVTPSSNRHPIGDKTITSSPPLSSEDEEIHAGSRKSPLASDNDQQETTQQSTKQ